MGRRRAVRLRPESATDVRGHRRHHFLQARGGDYAEVPGGRDEGDSAGPWRGTGCDECLENGEGD